MAAKRNPRREVWGYWFNTSHGGNLARGPNRTPVR